MSLSSPPRSRRKLLRQLRDAGRTRTPSLISSDDIVSSEATVRTATISGVRFGPSDLRAPREYYRFDWAHERELWIGCLLSEHVRRIRDGVIYDDVLCPLGRLNAEMMWHILRFLHEGAKPEADPELLGSLRGTPLAEVDSFLEGVTVCHALWGTSNGGAAHGEQAYLDVASRAISRVGYLVECTEMENALIVRRGGRLQRYEILCTVASDDRLRQFSNLSPVHKSIVLRCSDGNYRLYTVGPIGSILERLASHTGTSEAERSIVQRTTEHIREFDASGLTTLVYSTRTLSSHFFEDWYQRYFDVLMQAMEPPELPLMDELERGSHLLGSCAVELPLRYGVREVVQLLHEYHVPMTLISRLPTGPSATILQRSGIAESSGGVVPEGHQFLVLGTEGVSSPVFLALLRETQLDIDEQRGGGTGTRARMPISSATPESAGCGAVLTWLRKIFSRQLRRRENFIRMG
ncbi:hypothetical protein AB1Y20_009627 [Prymnesium parvum]|uniref:Uncharacterized protein n=1 Tax=Prymnesium parvum TaxID=97485 RepID=A0AB34K247_PRYPA